MRQMLFFAAVLAAALPAVAGAKSLPSRQFKADEAVTLNPARAYIAVRLDGGLNLQLLRSPTAAEQTEYDAERAVALERAKKKYAAAKTYYDQDVKAWNKADASDRAMMQKPVKPIEPTSANLAFPSIASDKFVEVWAGRLFDRPTGLRLLEVQPGTYRIYGEMMRAPNGSFSGHCLCMGSVQFDAAPGRITDMGAILYPLAGAGPNKPQPSWNGLTQGRGGLTAMRVAPEMQSVPASLASLPRSPAEYRAAGKIDNFFGVMVERLTALPGVLSYRRDEVVDVRTGTPVSLGRD